MIECQGVYTHHALKELIKALEKIPGDHKIEYREMVELTNHLIFLKRTLEWDLTIPHFDVFRKTLKRSYEEIKADPEYAGGKVATYIPPLARANKDWFASSFCSTDGQFA